MALNGETSSYLQLINNGVHTYHYTPLNESVKEIRILTLLPGTLASPLRVSLSIEILDPDSDRRPLYEALSYAWGSTENCKQILIEDNHEPRGSKILRVTQNLAAALLHLRYEHEVRRLWIDAICVNQQNLNERSSQVQRMGDVYRCADRVVVWLGVEENGSSTAIGLLRKFAVMVEVDIRTWNMKPSTAAFDEPEWADIQKPLPWNLQEMEALIHFVCRSWFERIWVQQEIRLGDPSKSIIQCGHEQMPWSSFHSAIVCHHLKPILGMLTIEQFAILKERSKLITYMGHKYLTSSFCDLFAVTKDCKCADPRDRVYSLVGISSYFSRKPVPDYRKSVSEVYQEMVLNYEISFHNLNILTTFEIPYEESRVPISKEISDSQEYGSLFGTPSWAQTALPTPTRSLLHFSWAHGGSQSWVQHDKAGVLSVIGVHLQETIRATKMIFLDHADDSIVKACIELYKFTREAGFRQGGDTYVEIFCRTLTGNNFSDLVYPLPSGITKLQASQMVLSTILFARTHPFDEDAFKEYHRSFLNAIFSHANNRSFFLTLDGKFGIGPRSARPGDQIVVFLGCRSPMLLRPVSLGQFQVVGEVFYNDACYGQALLGPIPESHEYRMALQYDAETADQMNYVDAFFNSNTLEQLHEDPRLGSLPQGWKARTNLLRTGFFKTDEIVKEGDMPTLYYDPRLTPEALKERGVAIRTFELV